jgi:peptidoglycan/LPS O-acetylase OafA/YrhL
MNVDRFTANHFIPQINALRAFSVIGVFIYHLNPAFLPGGFTGVDVFFVISGYLITQIIDSERKQNHFSLGKFYGKRIRRIFPALIVVIVFVWVVAYLFLNPRLLADLGRHMNYSSFFYLNFRLIGENGYFDLSSKYQPLRHIWSLCVEEQFYIVWPLLFLLIARLSRAKTAMIVLLIISSFAANLYLSYNIPISAYYSPLGRAWELGFGAALAATQGDHRVRKLLFDRRVANGFRIIGLLLIFAGMALINETMPFPGFVALAPTTGCILVIAGSVGATERDYLSMPVWQFFGRISYPLYLWHWPLISLHSILWGRSASFAEAIAIFAMATALAWITNQWIEKPIHVAYEQMKLATVAVLVSGMVIIGLGGMETTAMKGLPSRFQTQVANLYGFQDTDFAERDKAYPTYGACLYDARNVKLQEADRREQIDAFYESRHCFPPSDNGRKTIALVGDSHAGSLFPGLADMVGDSRQIYRMYNYFCAPLVMDMDVTNAGFSSERCRAINQYMISKLIETKPELVIIGVNFDLYANSGDGYIQGYVTQVARSVAVLKNAGVGRILISGQVPIWLPGLPELVADELRSGIDFKDRSGHGLSRRVFDLDNLLRETKWGDGVAYISIIQRLCDGSECLRASGADLPRDLIENDYGHLSLTGSRFIAHNLFAPYLNPK